MFEIKVGDEVEFRFRMKVSAVNGDDVVCNWTDNKGANRTITFNKDSLMVVNKKMPKPVVAQRSLVSGHHLIGKRTRNLK